MIGESLDANYLRTVTLSLMEREIGISMSPVREGYFKRSADRAWRMRASTHGAESGNSCGYQFRSPIPGGLFTSFIPRGLNSAGSQVLHE